MPTTIAKSERHTKEHGVLKEIVLLIESNGVQGLVTPQDHMSGGKRRRRGDSPGAWRKRRGDDMDGHMDAPPPPKRSANNKVLTHSPLSHHLGIRKGRMSARCNSWDNVGVMST